jgi:hypothetical protein
VPHFTLQITQEGALLTAFIGVSQSRRAALQQAGQPVPNAVQVRALVDTGASITAVDPSVLHQLSLAPTGSTTVNTPSTGSQPMVADQYDVSLTVPAAAVHQVPLYVNTLPVICAEILASQGFHALIGRDVLAQCVLSYNGSIGWFTLAY